MKKMTALIAALLFIGSSLSACTNVKTMKVKTLVIYECECDLVCLIMRDNTCKCKKSKKQVRDMIAASEHEGMWYYKDDMYIED